MADVIKETLSGQLDRIAVPTSLDVEPMIKPINQEAYASERLSRGLVGKGCRGNAVAANRTREIRLSGMRGGLAETWAMAELGTRCIHRKDACRKLSA